VLIQPVKFLCIDYDKMVLLLVILTSTCNMGRVYKWEIWLCGRDMLIVVFDNRPCTSLPQNEFTKKNGNPKALPLPARLLGLE